jgi:hypothetical protein
MPAIATDAATTVASVATTAAVIAAPIMSTLLSSLSLTPSRPSRSVSTPMCVAPFGEEKNTAPASSVDVTCFAASQQDDEDNGNDDTDVGNEQVLLLPIIDITRSSDDDPTAITPSTSINGAITTYMRLHLSPSVGCGVDMSMTWQAPAIDGMASIIAIAIQSNHMNGSDGW